MLENDICKKKINIIIITQTSKCLEYTNHKIFHICLKTHQWSNVRKEQMHKNFNNNLKLRSVWNILYAKNKIMCPKTHQCFKQKDWKNIKYLSYMVHKIIFYWILIMQEYYCRKEIKYDCQTAWSYKRQYLESVS